MINALKTESYSPGIFANLLKIQYKAINSFLDKPRLKFSRISGKSGDFPEKFCTGRVDLFHSSVIFFDFLYDGPPFKTNTYNVELVHTVFQYFFLTLYRWTGAAS